MKKSYCKPVFIGILIFIAFISSVSFTIAFDETSLTIVVHSVANHDPSDARKKTDMSTNIFLGAGEEPIGNTVATVLLKNSESTILVDPLNSDDDVPGLHVFRGVDDRGSFIEVSAYGFNHRRSREIINFDLHLTNAVFTRVVNIPDISELEGLIRNAFNDNEEDRTVLFSSYENPNDGHCGISANVRESNSSDDEFSVEIGGQNGHFCSITSIDRDRVRLYYEYKDMTSPILSNIVTDPLLVVIENDHISEQQIKISFDSSEFPLNISVQLRDNNGNIVDEKTNILIQNLVDLPYLYSLPLTIDEGAYTLHLVADDQSGNSAGFFVGNVLIRIADSNGDDDNGDDDNGDDDNGDDDNGDDDNGDDDNGDDDRSDSDGSSRRRQSLINEKKTLIDCADPIYNYLEKEYQCIEELYGQQFINLNNPTVLEDSTLSNNINQTQNATFGFSKFLIVLTVLNIVVLILIVLLASTKK